MALQFWVQPNRIFTVGVPQASHGNSTKLDGRLNHLRDYVSRGETKDDKGEFVPRGQVFRLLGPVGENLSTLMEWIDSI